MNTVDTFGAGMRFAHNDRSIHMAEDNPVVVKAGAKLEDFVLRAPIDCDRMFRVLELKIAGDPLADGGVLKWTPADWSHETKLPYILSRREPQSRFIARQRLRRWIGYFQRFDLEPTPQILFLTWQFGLTKAMERTKRGKIDDFTKECVELYLNLGC